MPRRISRTPRALCRARRRSSRSPRTTSSNCPTRARLNFCANGRAATARTANPACSPKCSPKTKNGSAPTAAWPTGIFPAMPRISALKFRTPRVSISTCGSTPPWGTSQASRRSVPKRDSTLKRNSPILRPNRFTSSARTSSTSTRSSGLRCSSSPANPTAFRITSTYTAS